MHRSIRIAAAVLFASVAHAATFTVTVTSDGGPGSLRQAILDANGNAGGDTIDFDIAPPGVHTIQPSSPLPAIIDTVIIDGTTQPGFAGTPVIEIDGSAAGAPANGLTLSDHLSSTIRGLVINRFQEDASGSGGRGLVMEGGGRHIIAGNFLGTDPTGTVDLGNERYGVACTECAESEIGGLIVADRNLLSGNDDGGVLIQRGNDVVVQGNYIGTDVTGTSALAGNLGVFVLTGVGGPTTDNRIGGTTPGAGNVIVANGTGVNIGNSPTSGTRVEGNLIGTDVTGTTILGNMTTGVSISSSPGNFIGGTAAGAGNVIAGASGSGVQIMNASADGNVVQGNYIGTDASGTLMLPNGTGVTVRASASGSPVGATIGGTDGANVITNSDGAGVAVLTGFSSNLGMDTSPVGVSIRENVIVNNGGLGIDLEDDGITPNDDDDPDDGANGLVNTPVVGSASPSGGMTSIQVPIDGTPNETFTVDVYANVTGDPSGAGEGETFLASVVDMTDGVGEAVVEVMIAGELPVGTAVTATATDSAGNTSEFAANVLVGSPTTTSSSTTSTTVLSTTTSTATSTSTSTTTAPSTSTTTTTVSTTTTATGPSTSTTTTTVAPTSSTTSSTATSTTATSTSATSTSSTTTSISTTSTTAPAPADLLTGAKLLLTDNSAKPRKRKLVVVSKDGAGLVLGDESAVLALIASGGSLRVAAIGGDGFDTSYPLAASSWQPLRKKKPEKGVRYKNKGGPVRAIVIKSGKRLLVKGKGEGLGHSLAGEPDAVQVELRVGARRFCLEFGGPGRFKPGKKLLRKNMPTASECPDLGSPSGAFLSSVPAASRWAPIPLEVPPLHRSVSSLESH